jgi:hypothetical protein
VINLQLDNPAPLSQHSCNTLEPHTLAAPAAERMDRDLSVPELLSRSPLSPDALGVGSRPRSSTHTHRRDAGSPPLTTRDALEALGLGGRASGHMSWREAGSPMWHAMVALDRYLDLRRCLWRRCAGPRSSAVRARSGTGPPGPAAGTSFENERKMSIPARIAARQKFVSDSCQGPEQAGTGQAGTYSPAGSGAGQEWEQPGPRGSACGLGVLPLLAAAIGAASAAAYYAAAATTTA